ncbi:Vacuolar protein sorting-associated protein 13 [Dimargaris xerosporica]|nr:Vacuolar protein sorting-associated protein 13 [Dimargaris xerosporica]
MFETIVANLLNKFLGDYVANLETDQLKIGVWQGDAKLNNLRLKREALDKFDLPIDVHQGYIGELILKIPWSNLKGEPVRVILKNVFVLAGPKHMSEYDPEEDDRRRQKRKQDKLETLEMLTTNKPKHTSDVDPKQTSFYMQLVTKIIDNLQVSIENIHIRYEDDVSNPDHRFAMGITLSELSAVSTDEHWNVKFIDDPFQDVHKLLRLGHLAVYFNSDLTSLAGQALPEFLQSFLRLIPNDSSTQLGHRYILRPVSGTGRLVLKKRFTPDTAKNTATFEFDELAFVLDDRQYKDALLLMSSFDYFIRQYKYRRYNPPVGVPVKKNPRAWLQFALRCVSAEVHERRRRWTWDYFKERREDRHRYVRLFCAIKLDPSREVEAKEVAALERKLSFQDIRFYRSIVESKLRKERALTAQSQKQHEATGKKAPDTASWVSSWFGSWAGGQSAGQSQTLSEDQIQELYDTIDFDEKEAIPDYDLPDECVLLKVNMQLIQGSLTVKQAITTSRSSGSSGPGTRRDLMAMTFDTFRLGFIKRPRSMSATLSLTSLYVLDGTTENSLYPYLLSVQQSSAAPSPSAELPTATSAPEPSQPFFKLTFDDNPQDERANSALTLQSRRLHFYFNPNAIETMAKFFRPPVPALDSVQQLILAASKSVEGFKQQTRAGFQYALEEHKTVDIQIDLDAPVIIIPSSFTDATAGVSVLDCGKLRVQSDLVAKSRLQEWRAKEGRAVSDEELEELKTLMYDRFSLSLTSVQLVVGKSVDQCLEAIQDNVPEHTLGLHVINRINMQFAVGISIVPQYTCLPKIVVEGHLPLLKMTFSDRKYRAIMNFVDMLDFLDRLEEPTNDPATPNATTAARRSSQPDPGNAPSPRSPNALKRLSNRLSGTSPTSPPPPASSSPIALGLSWPNSTLDDAVVVVPSTSESDGDDDEFFDAETAEPTTPSQTAQLTTQQIVVKFTIGQLSASLCRADADADNPEVYLAELKVERFTLDFVKRPYDMNALVYIGSLGIEDRMQSGTYLLTSSPDSTESADNPLPLLRVDYHRVDPESPEYQSKHEGMRQSVDVSLSRVNVNVIRGSILTLYDFILKTFVPPDSPPPTPPASARRTSSVALDARSSPFASPPPAQSPDALPSPAATVGSHGNVTASDPATVRVRVNLSGINFMLNNDQVQLATLSLSHANIAVLVREKTLRVGAQLGNLSLIDDGISRSAQAIPAFQHLLTIEGSDLADFSYETFDPTSPAKYPGFDAALYLRVGSARLTVAEHPIRALMAFGSQFAKMHVLFEAARKAAAKSANQLQDRANRFHFNINVKSPVLVFPERMTHADVLVANLGEIHFENRFVWPNYPNWHPEEALAPPITTADSLVGTLQQRLAAVSPHSAPPAAVGHVGPDGYRINSESMPSPLSPGQWSAPLMNKMFLRVTSIGLVSKFYTAGECQMLPLIDDVGLRVVMNYLERTAGSMRPEMEITAKLSDVHMKLTERQYQFLLNISTILSRTFAGSSDDDDTAMGLTASLSQLGQVEAGQASLRSHTLESDRASRISTDSFTFPDLPVPEAAPLPSAPVVSVSRPTDGSSDAEDGPFTTLDFVFNLETVDLEIFHGDGTQYATLANASFSRFCIQDVVVKHRNASNQSSDSEFQVHSFVVQDTRPHSRSQFPDLLPMADHTGPQLLGRINARAGDDTVLLATVDHPQFILDLNHVYALRDFFMSAFGAEPPQDGLSLTYPSSSNSDTSQSPASGPLRTMPQSPPAYPQQCPPAPLAPRPSPGKASGSQTANAHPTGFAYRVNIVEPEILILADANLSSSEAVVLSAEQIVVAQQGIFALTVDKAEMSLCRMDRREETNMVFIDPFDVVLSHHSGSTRAEHLLTNIIVDIKPLVLRLSYEDLSLLLEIFNKALQLSEETSAPAKASHDALSPMSPGKAPPLGERRNSQVSSAPTIPPDDNLESPESSRRLRSDLSVGMQSAASLAAVSSGQTTTQSRTASMRAPSKSSPPAQPKKVTVSREIMKLAFQGVQLVLIGNKIDVPVVDLLFDAFSVNLTDWSTQVKIDTNLRMHANYFNLKSSHWEPLIEPWQFGAHVQTLSDPHPMTRIDVQAKQKLDVNISHDFIRTLLNSVSEMTRDQDNYLYKARSEHIPYLIKNQTGADLYLWNELPDANKSQTSVQLLKNQESLPWRFGDWHRSRDALVAARNRIGLQFCDHEVERLKDIAVDREGSKLYRLRPRIDNVSHRLAVDVHLRHNVKEVTLRSALVFENRTLVSLELVMVDQRQEPLSSPMVVAPGTDCPVPLFHCHGSRVKVRPVDSFGYQWSRTGIYWEDLLQPTVSPTVACQSTLPDMPEFILQVHGRCKRKDVTTYRYPFMTIRLSAPLELENLLPYDVKYTVVDKKHNREWRSRLNKGAIAPVHVVRPRSLLLLSLEVPESPYRKSRYAVIDAAPEHDIAMDDELSLIDSFKRELPLRLERRKLPDSGGAHIVTLYCPYVMLNQSGLPMHLKAKSLIKSAAVVAGQGPQGIPGTDPPQPFMFSYGSYEPRNRCLIKVEGSEWSKPLSFEAVGSLAEVTIPSVDSATLSMVHLGVSVEPGPGKFSRTRVVTITPRYMLKNMLDHSLNFREVGSQHSRCLDANGRAPLHFLHQPRERQLSINFPGVNNLWSAPFGIDQVGRSFVKLNKNRLERVLVRIDVTLEGPCIFIIFSKVTGDWPYRIENASPVEVILYQRDASLRDVSDGLRSTLTKKYRLPPGRVMSYSWDYPSMKSKSLVLSVHGVEREVDIQQIGTLMPFKFAPSAHRPNTVSLDVVADRATQVLRITPYNQSKSLFRPRVHRRDSMREAFEVVDTKNVTNLTFRLRLAGIGISIINAQLQELMYATFRGIEFKFIDSTSNQSLNWMIEWVQFDNQLYGGLNEIVLYPTVIPKTGQDEGTRHILHAALVRAKDESYGVNYIRYFSILLQEMSLEMDENFLYALLEFAKFEPDETGTNDAHLQQESEWCDQGFTRLPDPPVPPEELQLYFEVLHIQPLKFNVSFVRTQRINQELDTTNSHNPLMVIGNALTMAIGNVNDAPVKLNSLVIENVRASLSVLLDRFTKHYGQEALYQIHKVLGSADVIGNPVGLFSNISSGVADFFYEPYQGFVMSDRPQDFGIGLARGTYSLFSKTVYGFSDSFSKFAESVSKGLSVATLDRNYQDRRRIARTRNRPRHALYGVSQGATSFASSVASGISGVVMQPYHGAEKEGVGGFFKGVGKGIVGVVTKPMVGVFDLASQVTEGIKNTTQVFNDMDLDRVRLPRFVGRDGILHTYNQRDALGQFWLKHVNDGEYFYETYLAHLELRGSEMVILLTYSKLMMIKSRGLSTEWTVNLSALQSIHLEARGISVFLRANDEHIFVPIPEASSRRWLYRKLEEAVHEITQRKVDD